MHRTQLFIPEGLHSKLKSQSLEKGKTVSEFVRMVLDDHLNVHTRQHTEKAIVSLMAMTQAPDDDTGELPHPGIEIKS